MEGPIMELSWLSFLLLAGLVISILSEKLKIPDILLLIIAGTFIGIYSNLEFAGSFLTSFAIFALIMLVFDSVSKFKLKEVNAVSPLSLRLAFSFLFLCIIFLTLFTHLIFSPEIWSIQNLIIAGLFAALMSGTSASVMLPLMHGLKNRVVNIIDLESVINGPLVILIPFITLDLYFGTIQADVLVMKFLQGIMTGVGTGIVIGLIMFKLMQKRYKELISPLAVIATALATYTLAENMGGNGVLAVTGAALIFGNMALKDKEDLKRFSSIFTNFLKIIIFIMLGIQPLSYIIGDPINFNFVWKSLVLFAIYLSIRYGATALAFHNKDIKLKERMFMTLNVAKGIDVAVMILLLNSDRIPGIKGIPGLQNIIALALLFMLYSIVLSTIVVKFKDYFFSESRHKTTASHKVASTA